MFKPSVSLFYSNLNLTRKDFVDLNVSFLHQFKLRRHLIEAFLNFKHNKSVGQHTFFSAAIEIRSVFD